MPSPDELDYPAKLENNGMADAQEENKKIASIIDVISKHVYVYILYIYIYIYI